MQSSEIIICYIFYVQITANNTYYFFPQKMILAILLPIYYLEKAVIYTKASFKRTYLSKCLSDFELFGIILIGEARYISLSPKLPIWNSIKKNHFW